MDPWKKLEGIRIQDKEKYKRLFVQTTKKIHENKYKIIIGEQKRKGYFVVTEENRLGGIFVHIVPEETYELFKELQERARNVPLGFSVVAGKIGEKEIRVSCFGVQCNELGLSLARSTKRSRSHRLWKKGLKERQRLAEKAKANV